MRVQGDAVTRVECLGDAAGADGTSARPGHLLPLAHNHKRMSLPVPFTLGESAEGSERALGNLVSLPPLATHQGQGGLGDHGDHGDHGDQGIKPFTPCPPAPAGDTGAVDGGGGKGNRVAPSSASSDSVASSDDESLGGGSEEARVERGKGDAGGSKSSRSGASGAGAGGRRRRCGSCSSVCGEGWRQRSMFLFAEGNPVRRAMRRLVAAKRFDQLVLVCIMASSILIAVDNPLSDPDSPVVYGLFLLDLVFTVVFALEMVVRVIALGFVQGSLRRRGGPSPTHPFSSPPTRKPSAPTHSPSQPISHRPAHASPTLAPSPPPKHSRGHVASPAATRKQAAPRRPPPPFTTLTARVVAGQRWPGGECHVVYVFALPPSPGEGAYLRSAWNAIDFFIVLLSLTSLSGASSSSLKSLRALRTLRALRPLRVISRFPGLKLVINALTASMHSIMNVLLVGCACCFSPPLCATRHRHPRALRGVGRRSPPLSFTPAHAPGGTTGGAPPTKPLPFAGCPVKLAFRSLLCSGPILPSAAVALV